MTLDLQGFRERSRRENARYGRGALDRLMDDLGSEVGAFARLTTLLEELRADGFTDAAFCASQALLPLKQAEMYLERAKGKLA